MSRKKQVNQKITALYCRISLDDGSDNESMSISNQKLMLRDFAEKNGMFQYEYYVDDGYTGRNFNRPSFQRMIADIEAGKIGCVITKDLSRLGRNYIEAGSYIEIFFPKHNVRYIAITDGVDSLTRQDWDRLVGYGIEFGTEACMSTSNYVSTDFAKRYKKDR